MADEKDIFGLVWAATHNDRLYPSAAETRPKQKLRFPTLPLGVSAQARATETWKFSREVYEELSAHQSGQAAVANSRSELARALDDFRNWLIREAA